MHEHEMNKIRLAEDEQYYYWSCDCGAIGGSPVEPDELESIKQLIYRQ